MIAGLTLDVALASRPARKAPPATSVKLDAEAVLVALRPRLPALRLELPILVPLPAYARTPTGGLLLKPPSAPIVDVANMAPTARRTPPTPTVALVWALSASALASMVIDPETSSAVVVAADAS